MRRKINSGPDFWRRSHFTGLEWREANQYCLCPVLEMQRVSTADYQSLGDYISWGQGLLNSFKNPDFSSCQTWIQAPWVVPIRCVSWRLRARALKGFSSSAWGHMHLKSSSAQLPAWVTCSRSYTTCQWQHHDWTILLQRCFIHTVLLHPKTVLCCLPPLISSSLETHLSCAP